MIQVSETGVAKWLMSAKTFQNFYEMALTARDIRNLVRMCIIPSFTKKALGAIS